MKKIIIPVILIAIIGAVAYYFLVYKKKKAQADSPATDQDTTGKTPIRQGASMGTMDSTFPLKKGSKGNNVKGLQSFLNKKYKAGLAVDGDYGSKTDSAVKKYLNVSEISQDMYINEVFKMIGL